ncbi:MAG TPA: hypothetical protein VLE93_01070 [Candidatus Saccharimonadales bacterium]|nr:hypothetical protein [Candidatus Saccharimonadales bacterium]
MTTHSLEQSIATFALLPDDFELRLESGHFISTGNLRRQLRDAQRRELGSNIFGYTGNILYMDAGPNGDEKAEIWPFLRLSFDYGVQVVVQSMFERNYYPYRIQLRSVEVEGKTLKIKLQCCTPLGNCELILTTYPDIYPHRIREAVRSYASPSVTFGTQQFTFSPDGNRLSCEQVPR